MNKRLTSSGFGCIVLLLIIILQELPVSAQDDMTDSLANNRLKEIQAVFYRDRKNAQQWWYGWLGAYSVATVGQGAVYFSNPKLATKQDMALGSITTILGALGQVVTPLVPRNSSQRDYLNSLNSSDGQNTHPEYFEGMLKEIASREKAGRSWKIHAVTGAANLASGLVTWIGFDRSFGDGLLNFALNTAVTEAQIWSQPSRAVKDYRKYCEKYYPGVSTSSHRTETEWMVQAYPGGISIRYNF